VTNGEIDVRSLPSLVMGSRAAEWWGIMGLVVIEGTVFVSLVASYFHFRLISAVWPQGGLPLPDVSLPSIAYGLLVLSAVPAYLAHRAARDGDLRRVGIWLVTGMAPVAGYLSLRVVEYAGLDYDWTANAYASITWTMTGLHLMHATAVLLFSGAVTVLAWQGHSPDKVRQAAEVNAIYWYFVVVLAFPTYGTLYWAPRLM